jgi:chlorobactene glucosyltransferase
MRNEAEKIGPNLRALLAQDYPNYEVLLLDDDSQDASVQAAQTAAGNDTRFRLLRGKPLPPGWLGKAWACQQLSQAANGDFLLFTDADVTWQPGALSATMAEARRTETDLLTLWPTQQTETWTERLVVPLMAFAIQAYLPALAVHHLPWKVFAAANGQVMLFRHSAYKRIGRHATVKTDIVEDMALAYAVKAHGRELRMADANRLIYTRMYQSWPEVRDGFAKNILAGHGGRPALLLASFAAHFLWFIIPWGWLVAALVTNTSPGIPVLLASLGLLIRALSAAATRQRIRDSLLMPVSVLLMSLIALRSLYWHWTGRAQWKDRAIRAEK